MEKPNFAERANTTKSFQSMNANTIKDFENSKRKEKEEELRKKEEEIKRKEEELERKAKELESVKMTESKSSVIDKYKSKKKEEKKKTSLNLSESVFNKLITLSAQSGETITAIVEDIITEEVKDIRINHEAVREYNKMIEDRKNKKKRSN